MNDERKEDVDGSTIINRQDSNQLMDQQHEHDGYDEQKYSVDENDLESVSSAVREEIKKKTALQEDIKLLQNRTKHLRREHGLAQLKIAETKKRTEQIYKQRERRDDKLKERKLRELQESKSLIKMSSEMRNRERMKNKRAQQDVLEEKRAGSKEVSLIKSKIKKDLEIRHEEELKAKRQQRQHVQKQLQDAQTARRKREEETIEQRRKNHTEALMKTKTVVDAKAKEIETLEEEELKLIEQLRKVQNDQRGAFQQLEDVLT